MATLIETHCSMTVGLHWYKKCYSLSLNWRVGNRHEMFCAEKCFLFNGVVKGWHRELSGSMLAGTDLLWLFQMVTVYSPLTWGIYTKPPPDIPECGFVGEFCPPPIRGRSQYIHLFAKLRICRCLDACIIMLLLWRIGKFVYHCVYTQHRQFFITALF